jgi:hypothetical protein
MKTQMTNVKAQMTKEIQRTKGSNDKGNPKNKKEKYQTNNSFSDRQGQSVLETAVLIVVLVSALVAMHFYLRRGMQGRLRKDADTIGEQYDPDATVSDFTLVQNSSVTTTTTSLSREFKDPDTWESEDRLVTTVVTQTHYDNMIKSGTETVGVFK